MFYLIILSLLCGACVQNIFTAPHVSSPGATAPRLSFVIDEDVIDMQTVVVGFEPERFALPSLPILRAKLQVNTSDRICAPPQTFTLQWRNIVGKLTCRGAPPYHNVSRTFADKLYFFPRGAHCQVGRLRGATDDSYTVEFCGMQNRRGDGFHDCATDSTGTTRNETVARRDFDLTQAAYPFDPLTTLQINYTVQVREKNGSWHTIRASLNGSGVLATGRSCLFRDGCQVRIDPHDGKCIAPHP